MEQHPKYNSIWTIPRLTVKIFVLETLEVMVGILLHVQVLHDVNNPFSLKGYIWLNHKYHI
jgi:hypothetical protein